jgi:hypothetical protein
MAFTFKGPSPDRTKNRRKLNRSVWRQLLKRDWKALFPRPTPVAVTQPAPERSILSDIVR